VSTVRAGLAALASAAAALAPLACTPHPEHGERRFELDPPPLAHPASPRPRRALEYKIDASNRAALELRGRQRRVDGELPIVAGRLWVDPTDVAATRAELTFDLAAIRLWDASPETAGMHADEAGLTDRSLEWLQLFLPGDVGAHPELRYARFTLLSIGSSSSSDLDAAPTVRSGQPTVVARRVRLRASGELELHGRRLPQTVSLDATFEWTAPAEPDAPPRRILLETAEPLELDLLGYGVVPRDARGSPLADELAELRRLPWKPLQIRAHWRAERAAGSP
jgi:hypothetical protein